MSAFGADSYPSRTVHVLVGFSAGGPTDIVARLVAARLGTALNQTFIVENKPGASGALAANDVKRAAPDGYTLLINASTSHTFYPLIAKRPSFDPIKDFTAISLIGVAPTVISVSPKLGVHNLQEFIALLKANPGKYSFGSAGPGSMSHLAGELFKQEAGVDIVHVPYKGAAPGLQDLVSGQIQMFADTFSTELPFHRQGLIRIVAVCAKERSAVAPDIPTTVEQGLPRMIASTYNELMGPPNMPKPIVDRLTGIIEALRNDKDFQQKMGSLAVEVRATGSQEAALFTKEQLDKWRPVVKSIGLSINY